MRGTARIEKREECEMIMMIGLPASGKTTWVNKLVAENPEKHYNVIGTSTLISKMTVRQLFIYFIQHLLPSSFSTIHN